MTCTAADIRKAIARALVLAAFAAVTSPLRAIEPATAYIRTANDGDQARFAWSADGRIFRDFGPAFTLKFGQWTGDRLGFFSWNDCEPQGHIDVDWFHYSCDGPKAGRPDEPSIPSNEGQSDATYSTHGSNCGSFPDGLSGLSGGRTARR